MPGDAGFDPWCLTDPDARKRLAGDREAGKPVRKMWELDPDPARTLAIHAEIQAAFGRGDIGYAMNNGTKLGHFFCCPWGAVYVAKRAVTLGGTRLRTMQQLVFEVSAEGVNLGEKFKRGIMVGNFQPTDQFEYGDPDEAPDH